LIAVGKIVAVDYLSALNAGSGLNVTQIVDSLVEAERVPRQSKIEESREEASVSISALGSLKQELKTFNTNIDLLDGQVGLTLASSNSNIALSRTDNNTASEFNHSIEVSKLATSHVINFSGFASTTDDLGLDQLTLDVGSWGAGPAFTANGDYTTTTLNFAAGDRSLTDIKDAINNADIGVTAEILEVSSGSYSLMVKSMVGGSKELRVRSFLSAAEVTAMKFDPENGSLGDAGATVVDGNDATFTIDGIAVTRETNSITDLFNGIRLDLSGTTSTAASISSSYSETTAIDTLGTVVSEINYLINFLKEQTKPGVDGDDQGALHGDYFIKSLETRIKTLTTTPIKGFDDEPIYMSNFGIMTERDGTLSIDEARFKDYFARYPSHLAAVTTSMIRAADAGVSGSTTTDLYTPGVYNFQLSGGTATLDGVAMVSGTSRHTITTGDAKGLILDTTKSTVDTSVYMGRSLLHQLSNYVDSILRLNGEIDSKIGDFQDSIDDLDADLEKLNDQMEKQRALYVERFTAMETAVAGFKETGEFLDNFIKSWQSNN
jgi:flagellar hook-associated protein 2